MSAPDPGLLASIVGRLKLNYSALLYTILYTIQSRVLSRAVSMLAVIS